GFQGGPAEDVLGFRIGSDGEFRQDLGNAYPSVAPGGPWLPAALPDFLTGFVPARSGFPGSNHAGSADSVPTPTLVPGPGGDGSGSGWDRCTLMPGFQQFGMCLYRCPDGTVRRLDRSPLGCQPFIFRNGGLGV